MGRLSRKLLRQSGIKPEQILITTFETGVSFAAYGIGGFFVSDMCSRYFESKCQPAYYSVGKKPQLVEYFAAHRKSTVLTQAQHDFIEIIRKVYVW